MATIEKRTRPRPSLGEPPAPTDVRGDLAEPETAPARREVASPATRPVDGRTLRRTGRTEQFATRVHPDFRHELAAVARATGKRYNEILEESLTLFRQQLEANGISIDTSR